MGEMIFIFLIVLLLFGAKRLPEIGSSLGKGIREFKSSVRDIERELSVPERERQIHRTTPPPPAGEAATESEADGEPRTLSDGVPTPAE
ncbi:MAG TPA: twin-arginine translocase TatA/TatE family subunit [Longimicrobiales bacterium]|nr:twin-arginine translocase TatA/TatE family subunit [Longimicrobiales bacterium]